jgi:hypothetical protein
MNGRELYEMLSEERATRKKSHLPPGTILNRGSKSPGANSDAGRISVNSKWRAGHSRKQCAGWWGRSKQPNIPQRSLRMRS